jgi:starch synthase
VRRKPERGGFEGVALPGLVSSQDTIKTNCYVKALRKKGLILEKSHHFVKFRRLAAFPPTPQAALFSFRTGFGEVLPVSEHPTGPDALPTPTHPTTRRMNNAMRILFVSGEVAPFTQEYETAHLVRTLPERLFETGEYETRIMMPRYGIVSERRNRLHEVIRLSGAKIPMGNEEHTLDVKVASIPGIRLQVYFMDNNHYFKRKGIFEDKTGKLFPDNLDRALFFGRCAITTIRNLGWTPHIVHAFGWMSSFVPMLLRRAYLHDTQLQDTRIVYTPEQVPFQATCSAAFAHTMGLPQDETVIDQDPAAIGSAYADAVIFPPSIEPPFGAPQFGASPEDLLPQLTAVYEQVMSMVLA